jgi:hypothetical protein
MRKKTDLTQAPILTPVGDQFPETAGPAD